MMILPDTSMIDFNAIETVRITKRLKEIAALYRACRFEEANEQLSAYNKLPHQAAAIKAQISFFNWDFDSTIEHIMDYFPYLCEWYTGNIKWNTFYMLVFSLLKSNSDMRRSCLEYLDSVYKGFSDDQLESKNYWHFTFIPEMIKAADGNMETNKKYVPPNNPKSFNEIFEGYAGSHKRQLEKLSCSPEEDAKTASDLLLLIYSSGSTEDFIRLYEKHCKSPKNSDFVHFDAARIYMYLGNNERAAQALCDYAEFVWYPIEFTDVKPVSILDGFDLFPLFTKDLFKKIYNIPRII